jgi:hypothetical protein
MQYHLVSTEGTGGPPAVRTVTTAGDAEREALRAAMLHADWTPKRYPGRTWKRGEVAVFLDRESRPERPPVRRELSILRCAAPTPAAPDCLLASMGIPALNLEPAPAVETPRDVAATGGQRTG